MPGYDQTGPQGDGPLSGRVQGRCSARFGRAQRESGDYAQGRGRRQHRGSRCGIRNRFGHQGSAPNGAQPINQELKEK